MKQPKYFATNWDNFAKEVLTPTVYKQHGEKGLRLMDERILWFLDEFRSYVDVPLTVNTYSSGVYTQSGLRDINFYGTQAKMDASLSDHKMGRAVDVKASKGGVWLREMFIAKEEYFHDKYGINFIEVSPVLSGGEYVTMNWAHFGIQTRFDEEVLYWSPKNGFVTKEDVLKNKW